VKRSDSNVSFDFCQRLQLLTTSAYFRVERIVGRFRSTLNLARLPLETRFATMEIRGGLVVTPFSATRRFPPTRWLPRRAGTGRAPKGISLLATSFEFGICVHPHFSCDEDVID